MYKFVFFSLSLITSMAFFCFSCTENPVDLPRLERIAKAYCDCVAASELQVLNDKAASISSDKLSEEEGLLLFENLQKEFIDVKECTGTITSNLGKVKGSELDSLNKILPTTCPEVARDPQQMKEFLGM